MSLSNRDQQATTDEVDNRIFNNTFKAISQLNNQNYHDPIAGVDNYLSKGYMNEGHLRISG